MAQRTDETLQKMGDNLRRLMADLGLTVSQVTEQTGVDQRTIKGVLDGTKKPQIRTFGRLAKGLGVSSDEFFVDPAQLLYRHFDEETNLVVEEVVQTHPEVFVGWTTADFEELHSRFGTGGPLTPEGALTAAQEMNGKRKLHEKLSVLLESSQAELVAEMVELLYQKVAQAE